MNAAAKFVPGKTRLRSAVDGEILANLNLTDRPGVYIDRQWGDRVMVLESDEEQGDLFLGVLMTGTEPETFYLGCMDCLTAIEPGDAAVCLECRKDAAANEKQYKVWTER